MIAAGDAMGLEQVMRELINRRRRAGFTAAALAADLATRMQDCRERGHGPWVPLRVKPSPKDRQATVYECARCGNARNIHFHDEGGDGDR